MLVQEDAASLLKNFDRAILEVSFFFLQEAIKLNIYILYLFGKRKLPYLLPPGEHLKASLLVTVPACLAVHILPVCSLRGAKYDLLI